MTFESEAAPGIINLGIGQPSADLLPVELMRTAADRFLARTGPGALNYGERQGDAGFRETLSGFLSGEYDQPVAAESLFVTAGSSQALDFVCSLFTQPGDTVVVEEPTYFLAFRIFRDHGLNIVPLPIDHDGMDIAALKAVLTRTKPGLVYTIPSYHNPGGQSMSAERRQRLVELSRESGFVVVADEVYQMLWYHEPPPPPLGTLTDRGNVLSLGSFSKILAPGLRLGWIQTSADLMQRILDSGVINSGGSLNQFTSLVVREAIEGGQQSGFLQHLRDTYARRVEVMEEALQQHFAGRARWRKPGGGYFFWLEFADEIDTAELRAAAEAYGTGFQPGANASCSGGLRNCLRLSFAHYGEDEIRAGVAGLARLFDAHGG